MLCPKFVPKLSCHIMSNKHVEGLFEGSSRASPIGHFGLARYLSNSGLYCVRNATLTRRYIGSSVCSLARLVTSSTKLGYTHPTGLGGSPVDLSGTLDTKFWSCALLAAQRQEVELEKFKLQQGFDLESAKLLSTAVFSMD